MVRRARWIGAALGVAFALASPGAQSPQPSEALASLLALPISPGAIALLLPHTSSSAAVERISVALAHDLPDVRAVAARVAFTTRHAALAPALVRALATETHPVAGTEEVRALWLIQGERADATIEAALPRLDSRAAGVWDAIREGTQERLEEWYAKDPDDLSQIAGAD